MADITLALAQVRLNELETGLSQNSIDAGASISRPEPAHHYQHIYNANQSPGRLESCVTAEPQKRARSVQQFSSMWKIAWKSKRSRIKDDRDTRLIKKQLERYPHGYPRNAAFIDSADDTVLFRRFGNVQARSLLYKEVELTDIEAKLDALDNADAGTDGNTKNRWRLAHAISLSDGRENEERKALIEEWDKKMEVYQNMLLREAQIRKLSRPTTRVHRNFMDFFYTENSMSAADQRFIYHEHDFVSLEEHEGSELDEWMHRVMGHCRKPFLKWLFVNPDDQMKTKDPHIHYYSADRLGALIRAIIAIVSTTLLLIPIYLFLVCNLSSKLMALITLAFAFFFAAAVSLFTSARRYEVFAATAAYCAVMVVFIGNIQQKNWAFEKD